jgi:GTPase SAR1 family protein
MAPMYYRNANAALLVFDITQYDTFEAMKTWVKGKILIAELSKINSSEWPPSCVHSDNISVLNTPLWYNSCTSMSQLHELILKELFYFWMVVVKYIGIDTCGGLQWHNWWRHCATSRSLDVLIYLIFHPHCGPRVEFSNRN